MCRFASFVLTKDREFYNENGDSHSDIISKHCLNEWGVSGPNIVKVEIVPTAEIKTWPSLKKWKFVIDQDVLPAWADREELETRTRIALQKRYKKGFKTVNVTGCTLLTSLKADAAQYVNVSGCTSLTSLKADAAQTVDVEGCTSLTSLKTDAAQTVYARGCTSLTSLKADTAQSVYASGCTSLTYEAKKGQTIYR